MENLKNRRCGLVRRLAEIKDKPVTEETVTIRKANGTGTVSNLVNKERSK